MANLTGVVHADFEHCYPGLIGEPQNGERESDLIVKIAGRFSDGQFGRQHFGDDIFG